jgi:hypothetical protein
VAKAKSEGVRARLGVIPLRRSISPANQQGPKLGADAEITVGLKHCEAVSMQARLIELQIPAANPKVNQGCRSHARPARSRAQAQLHHPAHISGRAIVEDRLAQGASQPGVKQRQFIHGDIDLRGKLRSRIDDFTVMRASVEPMQRARLWRVYHRRLEARDQNRALVGNGIVGGPFEIDACLVQPGATVIVRESAVDEKAGRGAQVLMQATAGHGLKPNLPKKQSAGIAAHRAQGYSGFTRLSPVHRCGIAPKQSGTSQVGG